ncbi:MAG: hypothetical protein AB7W16_16430 [Candidatus Obscuribacterales bacterium]
MPVNKPKKSEAELVQLVRKNAQKYLNLPNVTSVGVGYKITDGKPTGELCFQFTVRQKLGDAALESAGMEILPKEIDGVKVDVIERSYHTHYDLVEEPNKTELESLSPRDQRRTRLNRILPGISVCNAKGTAGTLGAIVYDIESGDPLILSNWHVLNGPNGRVGDTIVQPGPYDDPDYMNNKVGRLLRSHLGLAGDCAVSSIDSRSFSSQVLDLDVVPSRIARVNLGDKVVKSGRTTAVTYGVVRRVGVTTKIEYGGEYGEQAIGAFEIGIDPDFQPDRGEVSEGGDSGSLWMIHENGKATDIVVGLHFAGETDPNPDAEHALACNIHSVCEKLKVSFTSKAAEALSDEDLWNDVFDRLEYMQQRLQTVETASVRSMSPSAAEMGVPVYGHWCGPGYGAGEPVDDLDAACMRHDKCYGDNGYFNCQCDKKLVSEIDQALGSGRVKPFGRVMGPVIRSYFKIAPCKNGSQPQVISDGNGGWLRRRGEPVR